MEAHQKHAKLNKPDIGNFSRNEIAILGTPCGNIKTLAFQIIENLSSLYKIAYVDADHKSADQEGLSTFSALSYGASVEYTDKINYHRFDVKRNINEYEIKQQFIDDELVLVNGNHFLAKSQVIVIDAAKPLEKKLDKLTNVIGIIFKTPEEVIPDYLKGHISGIEDLPVFQWAETDKINEFVRSVIEQNNPVIKGLVLAGGKSQRMKTDKALLNYHGKGQISHVSDLLRPFCSEVYISCPSSQKDKVPAGLPVIEDAFIDMGPFGAILSAFKQDPNVAWLVVACDLPFLNEETLQVLIANRDVGKTATAFLNRESNFPEPLITLWEPKSYFKLLYFLGLGYSCPRKVLINTDCHIIEAPDQKALQNVNYPEEFEKAVKELRK